MSLLIIRKAGGQNLNKLSDKQVFLFEKITIKINCMFIKNIENDSFSIKGTLLTLSKVSKSFGAREIFSGVDLVVGKKDRISIIGQNGTGKSTLLKIMIGLVEADSGEVFRNKSLQIGYLPQETHWNSLENKIMEEMRSANEKIFSLIKKMMKYEHQISDMKRADLKKKIAEYGEIVNEYEVCEGYKYENRAEDILKKFNFLEDDWGRKVKSLSGGERTRLALAKIVLNKPNILIMDEPTNHLDLATIEWLENFLLGWGMAIVIVSHDRRFLDSICNNTFELKKEGSKRYYCNYSGYLEEKREERNKKEGVFKRQKKYLDRQMEFIECFRYKATKASAVQSRIKMIDKIEKLEKPQEDLRKIKIRLNFAGRIPQKVLTAEDLFFGIKDFPLVVLEGVWEVEKKDKIGIIGPNGAGKSTLLKTLIGKNKSIDGKVNLSKQIKIGYYAQSHEELDPEKNIMDEVASKTKAGEGKIRNILGSLLFTKDDVYKNISDLSGGERARVAIAELILNESNMLFLDEPTNHLDLESKRSVIEVLKNFDGPIIIVSHDRDVINKVCNTIWEVKNNEVKKYLGNYDDYLYKKGENNNTADRSQ